jgi:hypothetical protein
MEPLGQLAHDLFVTHRALLFMQNLKGSNARGGRAQPARAQ